VPSPPSVGFGRAPAAVTSPVEPATAPTQINALQDLAENLIGTLIDNRYRIVARIAAGNVGVVYRAEHIQIRRPVAVKVLHAVHNERDDYIQRFEREALAASKLNHPACVSVLDFGRFDGRPYLVMEYVEGNTLADHLKDHGALPVLHAVLLTRLILSALRHTHKLGVIHRDIKPANLMLCDQAHTGAQLRILDFGLAKSIEPADPAGRGVTMLGVVCGTPGYLSPEQAAGFPLDARSDLYSVGAVLFTMVCGQRPFVCDDPIEEMRAHITAPPPPARSFRPELSPDLEAVITRSLAKDPGKRFQTADEFIAALVATPELKRAHSYALAGDLSPSGTPAIGVPIEALAEAAALGGPPPPNAADASAMPAGASPGPSAPPAPGPGEKTGAEDSWAVLQPTATDPAWARRKSGLRLAEPSDSDRGATQGRALRVLLILATLLILGGAIAAIMLIER
jgi:serine/threonine protein kinase